MHSLNYLPFLIFLIGICTLAISILLQGVTLFLRKGSKGRKTLNILYRVGYCLSLPAILLTLYFPDFFQ